MRGSVEDPTGEGQVPKIPWAESEQKKHSSTKKRHQTERQSSKDTERETDKKQIKKRE